MWIFGSQSTIVVACFALAVFAGTPVVRRLLVVIESREPGRPTEALSGPTVGREALLPAPGSRPERIPGLESAGEPMRGGYWIGLLERAAVFACVLSSFPAGIAIVLGVKGLGRYPELRTPTSSKGGLFLIGTFSSMLWAALCSGLAYGLVGLVPAAIGSAAESELLPNADFSAGAKGWGTNRSSETLTILNGGIAQLTTKTGGPATLNDRPNAVQNKAKGTNYVATARVRTTTPNVPGTLRIREVSGTQVNTSKTNFTLNNTSWQVVTLNLTTVYTSSHLDFNLNSYSLPSDSNLQIDWVSVKLSPTTTPVPPPGGQQPPSGQQPPVTAPGSCKRETLSGTTFGSTLDVLHGLNKEQAWARANRLYGKPGIIRTFHPGAPSGWQIATVAKGADLSVSFKIQPKDVLSGANDAKLRAWFQSAPKDVSIYWTYFHEPEDDIERGAFTPAQYRAAWQRIHKIANETCQPNMHSTLILTSWTLSPGSGRDFKDYYPGSAYIDVLSWDPYNPWGGTIYKDPKVIYEKVVLKSKAEGKPFAIAETGSLLMGNDKGAGRAAWLTSMAKYLKENGALYVAYYDTSVSKNDMRLLDKPSQDAWKQVVQG